MAKKKNSRQRRQSDACNEDSSDGEDTHKNVKACPHISKAVNMGRMKKAVKNNADIENCMDCKKDASKNVSNESENKVVEEDEESVNDVWLCLQCGHCGCGRNAPEQHAVKHHKTPRSDSHAIVLSVVSMSVWCYDCDDEVRVNVSHNIKECIEFVSKSLKKKPAQNSVNDPTEKKTVPSVLDTHLSDENSKKEVSSEPKNSSKISKNTDNSLKHGSINKYLVKGLRNLGNTCFFNAVMQNLCRTPWLLHELEERANKSFTWEIPYPLSENIADCSEDPLKVTLPDYYIFTEAFLSFLKTMNSPTNKSEIVNPSQLFEQVCKKSPQFRGFQQQDSHELLRHLLDSIRNEEIKRQKKGILKALNLGEKINPENIDDKTKQLVKAYGKHASHTIIERIFGGQLLSTVLCEECRMSSQVFEPFMDLSLPLAEEKPLRSGKVQKQPSSPTDDFDVFTVLKKDNNETKLSKHQEKKLKQQQRKAAKKKVKFERTTSAKLSAEESDVADIALSESNNPDKNKDDVQENANSDVENDTNNAVAKENSSECDLSDADVEDNDESENASQRLIPEKASTVSENNHCTSNDCTASVDDRIQELCKNVTDIRIRQDSDRQEDILDPYDDTFQSSDHPKAKIESNNEKMKDENAVDWSHSQSEQQTKEWMFMSLTTVKPRYQPSSLECSVNSCLNQFTASELLTGSNKFRCENCTNQKREATGDKSAVIYSNASKQMLIFSPPAVLTLHLKRFQQVCMSLRKLNLFVTFPLILDLAPYCSSLCLRLPHMANVTDEILYSLYGIVQHSGKLTSGHYTAYVKVPQSTFNPNFLNDWPMGQCSLEQLLQKMSKIKPPIHICDSTFGDSNHKWYYISDGHYNEVSESEVLRCQAYILFYQRIK